MDRHSYEDKVSETKRQYSANYGKWPIHTRFKNGHSGNSRGAVYRFIPLAGRRISPGAMVLRFRSTRSTGLRCADRAPDALGGGGHFDVAHAELG